MNSVLDLAREDLRSRRGYLAASPARDSVRLHANEAPWCIATDGAEARVNWYPPPVSGDIIERLCSLYSVAAGQVLVTRGSDEGIDILMRSFCAAGRDSVLYCPPTFGMYRQCAEIQGAAIVEVPLLADQGFALDVDGIVEAAQVESARGAVKLVFVCTPNNPTGNPVATDVIRHLCCELSGRALVVVDEAYVEFSGRPGVAGLLDGLPNLVVLRTLSKAFGLAGARCGVVLAHPDIINLLRSVLPPYVLPTPVVNLLDQALQPERLLLLRKNIDGLLQERERVNEALARSPHVVKIWPSAANFLLVRFRDARGVMQRCERGSVLLRDFSYVPGLENCIRVTIGTAEDNRRFLNALAMEDVAPGDAGQ
ncbi:MAG: histidinol-phosphate transaminase [Pseudomonadota bacterium]